MTEMNDAQRTTGKSHGVEDLEDYELVEEKVWVLRPKKGFLTEGMDKFPFEEAQAALAGDPVTLRTWAKQHPAVPIPPRKTE